MNGDGDIGDGNGLASVTGTAYTGDLLNGWRRFGDVLFGAELGTFW